MQVLGAAMRAASGAGPEPSPAPRQRMHFTAEASHAALAYAGPEFVLYAVGAPAGSPLRSAYSSSGTGSATPTSPSRCVQHYNSWGYHNTACTCHSCISLHV